VAIPIKDAMRTMQLKNIRRLVVVVEKEGKADDYNMAGLPIIDIKIVKLKYSNL
jgi:CBS domain-containing protein